MNTLMVKNDYGYEVTANDKVVRAVVDSLCRNNTFCPNVTRVIFNLSKVRNETSHRNDYTLATTVFFADNTKVTVKNSVNDKISVVTEDVKLSDGSTIKVETASIESREVGIAYAMLKRMICTPDDKGNINSNGFARFLRRTVSNAWNQPVEAAKARAEETIRKATAKKNVAANTKKTTEEKPSLRKCVKDLSDLLAKLNKNSK